MESSDQPPRLTPQEQTYLATGYAFSYFFHPVRALARQITIEAWDYRLVCDATQEKRRWWKAKKPTRTRLARAEVFLQALCAVSDSWERDQERAVPWRAANTYRPGAEDRLIRYVKFLLWRTMDRLPPYRALALGCLLYSYAPDEIAQCTMGAWDSSNFRRIKKTLLDWVTARFAVQTHTVPPHQEKKLVGQAPTGQEQELIMATLRLFSAWRQFMPQPAHPVGTPHTPLSHLFRDVTLFLQSLVDDQRHALACEVCGGIPQLVKQYNQLTGATLSDPEAALQVPLWCEEPPPPDAAASAGNRQTPPPLDSDDWQAIHEALADKQQQRNAYQGGVLRICVDGHEQQRVQTAQTASITLDIPAQASAIEVFGGEPHAEVLLAVVSLALSDMETLRQPRVWTVTHAGGQRLTIQMTAIAGEEAPRYQVHISYEQVLLRAVSWATLRLHMQRWCRHAAYAWGRLWPSGARYAPALWAGLGHWSQRWSLALVGLLLLSLGGNVWLSSRFMTRPASERRLTSAPAQTGESTEPAVQFNTAQFQREIQSTTDLETLATGQVVQKDPAYILGLAAPTTRATFVRLGVHYAYLLAALHSAKPERAAQQLDGLVQAIQTVPAPPVLGQYLRTIQAVLHSQQATSQEVALLVGLFEPLYAEAYGTDHGYEALTLFRVGTWLLNMSLAAAAGDTTALRQGPMAASLEAALTRLQAPAEILAMFTRLHHLMTRQEITTPDIDQMLDLLTMLQRRLST